MSLLRLVVGLMLLAGGLLAASGSAAALGGDPAETLCRNVRWYEEGDVRPISTLRSTVNAGLNALQGIYQPEPLPELPASESACINFLNVCGPIERIPTRA